MSRDSKRRSISDSLVLDDSEDGVVIAGFTNNTVAATSGLNKGDELVAATIQLDKLNKDEIMNILKILEPYEDNMKVVTKKGLGAEGDASLDLSLPDNSAAKAPTYSLNGLAELGGKINVPTVNGDIPGLSLTNPSTDIIGGIPVPSARLSGPDLKSGLGGSLTPPDVSVSTPQVKAPGGTLDIDKPETHYKAPKFEMPHFNLPQMTTPKANVDADLPSFSGDVGTPDLKLSAPQIKSPGLDLNGPKVDLDAPGVNLETPNANIKAPSGNIKWPHLNWNGPKIKGAKADVDAPNANLSLPKLDGDMSGTDVDLNVPTADIKGPNLDVKTPVIDVNKPSGKFPWPHTKWGKPKLHGPKTDLNLDANLNTPDVDLSVPNVKGEINAPDIDMSLPNAKLKGPDVTTPHIDSSHGINWPHWKWKKGKIHGPKADLDLSTPNIDGDINGPRVDLKGPHLQTPSIDAEPPSGKIAWPHQKWKKNKLHLPKANLDANMSTPDVDVSPPNIGADISAPDIDLSLPKGDLDVQAPELPSGRFKFPTMKKHTLRLSGPKVKSPNVDLDADLKAPDLNLSSPSLNGPDVDLNLPNADVDLKAPNADIIVPSVKTKWPTFKKSKLGISAPDADVSVPEANLKLPNAELDGPKLDVNAPDVDLEGPSGKFKWLNFKAPKFGTLKGPKADIDADVKAPNVDFSAPDVNLSPPKVESGIDTPDLKLAMPEADLKAPSVDLNCTDLDVDGPNANWKLPKLKLPKLKGPKVKGPELDADFKAPDMDASIELPDAKLNGPNVDLNAPDLSLSAPKIDGSLDTDLNLDEPETNWKFPKFKLPKLKGPKVKGPELDADLRAPDIDANLDMPDIPNVDLNAPDLSLSAPKIKGGIDTPDLDVNLPNTDVDIQAPDIDASGGKFKFPKIKMPKFDFSGKETNLDVDADLKGPDLSLDGNMPKVDLPAGGLNLKTPSLNASAPNLDAGVDLSAPKTNIDFPNINLPRADLSVPDLDLKAPNLSMSSPEIDGSLSTPNIGAKLPQAEMEAPDVSMKSPDIDLGSTELPILNLPKMKLSSPDVEVPSVDAGIETPRINIDTPSTDAKRSAPDVDLKLPGGDINEPKLNVKVPDVESKKSHFKFPKFNFLGSKTKSSEMDLDANLEDGSVDSENDGSVSEMEVPAFKFHTLPRNSVGIFGGLADAFESSKHDTDDRDYVVSKGGLRLPVFNTPAKDGERVDILERLKMAKDKIPSANVTPTEDKSIDLKLAPPSLNVVSSSDAGDPSLVRGGTFKVEKPEANLSLEAPQISSTEENDKFSLGLSNMLGLNN